MYGINSSIVKLDLGCGKTKHDIDYIGVDKNKYDGVNLVTDLRFVNLPFEDNTVDEVYSSHFLEHLTFEENVWLFNEIYRILKPEHLFEIIVPHGMSYAAFCDLSHKTFFTEDTFGYFTRENTAHYDWNFIHDDKEVRLINRWKVAKNDTTPPYEYTTKGWVEVKLREIRALLIKEI